MPQLVARRAQPQFTFASRDPVAESRELIVDTLRGRILRGLHAATLRSGDRLPSARDAAQEFDVDYRLVLGAYRTLAEEGLVEMRSRGGVYVAVRGSGEGGTPPLPETWLAEVLTQGLAREIAGPELHEWLRRATETLRLRAVVITSTADQVYALCRELRDDFGFETDGIEVEELRSSSTVPLPIRRADLLVATRAYGDQVRALGAELRKPVTVIEVRPDLLGGEWALLLRRPVYVVVATEQFGVNLRRFFAEVPGVENLRIVVFGRDDLNDIPDGAPTYVTKRVRADLGNVPLRGRILPAARFISSESARELFGFIVRANIETLKRRIP